MHCTDRTAEKCTGKVRTWVIRAEASETGKRRWHRWGEKENISSEGAVASDFCTTNGGKKSRANRTRTRSDEKQPSCLEPLRNGKSEAKIRQSSARERRGRSRQGVNFDETESRRWSTAPLTGVRILLTPVRSTRVDRDREKRERGRRWLGVKNRLGPTKRNPEEKERVRWQKRIGAG